MAQRRAGARRCLECGKRVHRVKVRRLRQCPGCRELHAWKKNRERQGVRKPPVHCALCGTWFTPLGTTRRYCTEACMNRANWQRQNRLRRVGRHGSERIESGVVFRRDSWRCQLCGRKVRLTKDPQAPTRAVVDHIVPLGRGGEDAYGNVQTACHACNQAKMARLRGQRRFA